MKRVVLITGVSGGIGMATARLFISKGWHVIGVDLRPGEPIAGLRYCMADVTDPLSFGRVFVDVQGQEGRLDVLVNNAAVQVCKPLLETSPEEWDEVMNANLKAVYLAVCYAHPLMRENGGAIVNVSSVHAVATSTNIAAYAASKGALLSLTKALAIELATYGIRVNTVLPGAVDTDMLRAGIERRQFRSYNPDNMIKKLGDKHIMGRVGRPDEIAEAILFLADEQYSSFITGQSLIVDGGATARLSTE